MSCCGLRAQITSLNSLFQKVHLNEVKPWVLGHPGSNLVMMRFFEKVNSEKLFVPEATTAH